MCVAQERSQAPQGQVMGKLHHHQKGKAQQKGKGKVSYTATECGNGYR
jgi:hypothetical protein